MFIDFIVSSKTAGLIETKLHVEPLWYGAMKVVHGSNDQDICHAHIWYKHCEN